MNYIYIKNKKYFKIYQHTVCREWSSYYLQVFEIE